MMRIVIVGAGMAGSKLAEELAQGATAKLAITLIGEEPKVGYNRIMLSSLLAQEISDEDMPLVDLQTMRQTGVDIIAEDPVVSISSKHKQVTLSSGRVMDYDKLVFATGSKANLLPIEGANADNVMGFRTWQDVDRMSALPAEQKVAVVGGGLLGLEAAVGLVKRGHQVTVFHRSGHLLNRQLDAAAASLLQNRLETMGIEFCLSDSPTRFIHDTSGTVCQLLHGDGQRKPVDLVIMAAGIVPETQLAQQTGLAVKKAILVDAQMTTSDADVYAVGECCEFEQQTFGLVAPIWSQIKVLTQVLAGNAANFTVTPTPTKLKVSGINLFSVGTIQPDAQDACLVFEDVSANHYRKLVVNDGQLVGAILYGNVADGSWYFQLIQNKTKVTDMLDRLIFGEAYCQPEVA
ncbi:NAD(P)/FAD-dependent oxidoreductase [Marinomonas sp. TW1]|uniref:NAD(P)/FAD-dependent oxidoreductase n=1 Tax=Marinomonas sp. TW1 TaxID=1561203 RepID=UPI0007B2D264|nr:FAD-dependent oxidoreductase [Marinomonas sp. TW1]KZN14836.1 pyridine nucleotide-disulfide oxidoreductase [Marinomonas sp. TW1]